MQTVQSIHAMYLRVDSLSSWPLNVLLRVYERRLRVVENETTSHCREIPMLICLLIITVMCFIVLSVPV